MTNRRDLEALLRWHRDWVRRRVTRLACVGVLACVFTVMAWVSLAYLFFGR